MTLTHPAAPVSPNSIRPSLPDPTPVKRHAIVDGTPFYLSPRYQDFKLLARGSYGVVISAFDNTLHRRVAIKKVHNAFENTTDAKHLVRELRLMRTINQQNVLRLLNIDPPVSFKGWNDVYMVSELLYDDLEGVLEKRKALSKRQVKFILWGMLCGLKYLHSAGVAHRDLKPGNLLIDKHCRVKIADLGLARVIEDENVGLTKHVMTKSYRAPEVFLTPQTYTDKIDMWSVGVILHELLAPHLPLFPKKAFKTQLDCIFSVIGKPGNDELQNLPDHVRWYVKKFTRHQRGVELRKRFGKHWQEIDPLAIDLVGKLIQFDPAKRPSAAETLEHPYLAEFHKERMETVVSEDERAVFDRIEPVAYGKHGLRKNELRRLVWNEMTYFHPEYPER